MRLSLEEIFLQLTTEDQNPAAAAPAPGARQQRKRCAMGDSIRNIRAIAAKEVRSYFSSPVAWVLMGLFAALFG